MMTRNAERAMHRSVTHDEIVTIEWDERDNAALFAACGNYVDTGSSGGLIEYWGVDDDGDEWRVHIVRQRT